MRLFKVIDKTVVKSFFKLESKRAAFLLIGCALILIFSPLAVSAVDLAQYRANVEAARIALAELQDVYFEEENVDFKAAARRVERLLPAKQSIELKDKTAIEVDNGWLAAELKTIESTALIDDKIERLNQIVERLGAIENRLSELETAQAATSAKNDDKQTLNEILRRAEYQKLPTETEKSVLERISDRFFKWIEDFFKWLLGDRAPIADERPATDFSSVGKLLQYLIIAVAVGLIGFVVWRFVLPLFGDERRGKSKKKEPRVILGETLTPDQTAADLLAQAESLALSGDVRAAIRKGYIALLCELSDRKLLGLARHKTNRDYLRDVRKKGDEIFQPMRRATETFEQHWYGESEATAQDWQTFRSQLTVISQQSTVNTVSS